MLYVLGALAPWPLSAEPGPVAPPQDHHCLSPADAGEALDLGPEPLWVDRTALLLREGACRSARWADGLFGVEDRVDDYRQASGTLATSLLWSQHDGLHPHVRFHVQLPLPQAEDRVHAFIGTHDRGEFVTERSEPSGGLPRQFGAAGDDETLLGLGYAPPPRNGGRFDTSAGIRIQWPFDPYLKASYESVARRGTETALLARETAFWEREEGFGLTLRGDVDRGVGLRWRARTELSGTLSQRTRGVRGYGTATLFNELSAGRAVAYQVGFDGETRAEVPLHDFGIRVSYRRRVWKDWLAIELRTSLGWPRDTRAAPRVRSFGAGLGLEMAFGGAKFRGIN